MTTTLAHGVGRSPGESVRPLRALAASPALIVLLLGGLALRLTIAYVLFPSSGFETDLASYASWALTLGEHGPGGFYANAGFSDYPPGYLYLLWPIGLLARGAADPRPSPPTSSSCRPSCSTWPWATCSTGWSWAGPGPAAGPRPWRSPRPRCTSSTRSPSTTRRCGARATRRARSCCCSGWRPSSAATARGRRRWPSSRRWSSRSSASCSCRSLSSCSSSATSSGRGRGHGTHRGRRGGWPGSWRRSRVRCGS